MESQGVFKGVRVIELAQFVFVPGASVMLADQGAEVIKVEAIEGDPYRNLQAGGSRNVGSVNISMEQNNRNKRSIALDLKSEEGREALLRLVEKADVFITSLRPKAIAALHLDVEDLRARNPAIIYARGNGVGFKGEEANRPGYDASVFWARGGGCLAYTRPGEVPAAPRPAFGDHTGSIALAYGIAGALFKRAMTGEPSVVETSLLATASWVLSGDITLTQVPGYETHPQGRRPMPLLHYYTTRDGRMVQLMMLNPQPRWPALCRILEIADLAMDPRFATQADRSANAEELTAIIQDCFARRDYAEWQPLLESIDIPWEPINTVFDVARDPQVHANGMIRKLDVGDTRVDIVAGPVAFDGDAIDGVPSCAPDLGADTARYLGEAGYSDGEVADLLARGIAR